MRNVLRTACVAASIAVALVPWHRGTAGNASTKPPSKELMGARFVDKIISDKLDLEKKALLFEFFRQRGECLSPKDATRLLHYASENDIPFKLLAEIIAFLQNSELDLGLDAKALENLVVPIIERTSAQAPPNFLVSLLQMLGKGYMDSLDDELKREFFSNRLPHIEIEIMKKNRPFFLASLRAGKFPCETEEGKQYLLHFLSSHENRDDLLLALRFAKDYMYSNITGLEELKIFAALAKNGDPQVASAASALLSKTTHIKKVADWTEWISSNPDFSIQRQASDICLNPEYPSDERAVAAIQIATFLKIGKTPPWLPELWEKAMDVLKDDSGDLRNRQTALSILVEMEPYVSKNKAAELEETRQSLFNDARFHPMLFAHMKERIDSPAIKKKALEVLKNEKMNPMSRSFAAYALGNSKKNKKQAAKAILDFLTDKINKNSRPARVALIGLTQLLGKNCGADLDAWKKAVDAMPEDRKNK